MSLCLVGVALAAMPAWTVDTGSGLAVRTGRLVGVSCTSPRACTAVGLVTDSRGVGVPLAERWNGADWARQQIPNPAGSKETELVSVSCRSSTSCVAIGKYLDVADDLKPLAERWNGTRWTIEHPVDPRGERGSGLGGLTCRSSSACVAVGFFRNQSGIFETLAERWNGTRWTAQHTPDLAGSQGSELLQVSCATPASCTAVGYSVDRAGKDVTLAEHWNGRGWAIEQTPNPAGAQSSDLAGVSCSRRSTCLAVGYVTRRGGAVSSLAEHWNGRRWVIRPTPNPAGSKQTALEDISCTSSAACTAVGDSGDRSSRDATVAEHWDGSRWTIQKTPSVAGATRSIFFGVSCVSETWCAGVGWFRGGRGPLMPLAARYSIQG